MTEGPLFEDVVAKRREQFVLFDTLPVVEIYGVVGARGISCGRVPSEPLWNLNLELIAWRLPGQPVHQEALKVTKHVTDAESQETMAQFEAESLVAMRVKLSKDSLLGYPMAQLVEVLESPQDEELQQILTEFRTPVVHEDGLLGRLELDKGLGWFTGKLDWLGREIEIMLSPDETEALDNVLCTAKKLLKEADHWNQQACQFAAEILLETKNDYWLDETDSPVNLKQFISCLSLESIVIHSDGEFEFGFNDGELFWGHSILVSGSFEDGFMEASIAG